MPAPPAGLQPPAGPHPPAGRPQRSNSAGRRRQACGDAAPTANPPPAPRGRPQGGRGGVPPAAWASPEGGRCDAGRGDA
eukprot:5988158-Prymnesium_polylepis.1